MTEAETGGADITATFTIHDLLVALAQELPTGDSVPDRMEVRTVGADTVMVRCYLRDAEDFDGYVLHLGSMSFHHGTTDAPERIPEGGTE